MARINYVNIIKVKHCSKCLLTSKIDIYIDNTYREKKTNLFRRYRKVQNL